MSRYELDKLLYEIQDPSRWEEFRSEPERVVGRYQLSPEERSAVVAVDATSLRRLGAQPYLLRFFTSRAGMSNDEFIRQIELA
jgi:hypothetical protein